MSKDNLKVVLTPSLAPYKVVLLALIAAYCAGILPSKTNRPLLTVIVKYIEGPSVLDKNIQTGSLPSLFEILRSLRESCLKAYPEEGSNYANDIEIRALHALWTLQSLDSLYSFITRAKSLLVKNYREGKSFIDNIPSSSVPKYLLTESSFLGSFVLNCVSSFESLEFDKIDLLWKSFVKFRASSKSIYEDRLQLRGSLPSDLFGAAKDGDDPHLLVSLFDKLPSLSIEAKNEVLLISQEDLVNLLEYQVKILENYGAVTTPEFRAILNNMPQSETGKIPTVHYIHYLECLREADYEGAFNYLHRYFDYMMSYRRTAFYHYALLSLATLYATFNCDGEAIRAMEESISVARENKDVECLNFLLTWLFNYLKDRPNLTHEFYVSNDQLLQFLKSRTSNESFKSLHTTAYQSDAVQNMLSGGSVVSTLESLTKSLYISVNCGNDFSSFVSHCSLASSFWYRAGQFDLAEIYNEIALDSSRSASEQVLIQTRKAYLEFTQGSIEESFSRLEKQQKQISSDLRLSKDFSNHQLLLLTEQSIRASNYYAAQSYLEKLEAQDYPNIDMQGQHKYLLAQWNLETGNYSAAHEIFLETISTFAKRETNKFWFIKFNLLNCDLFLQSDLSVRMLSTSIQCLNLSTSSGYFILALESILRITRALINVGSYEDAKAVIDAYSPLFEQSADLELKSKANEYKAAASIHLYKQRQNKLSKEDKFTVISKIIKSLEIAIDGFKKISSFKEIENCLVLQENLATLINHTELLQHASKALENIKEKIEQNSTSLY
ncbi:hypothetical protein WICMUC_001401 [Wickerhamomyces mucosus]|uniref:Anaphase-promoting complex subunit 5 n=1 Tax=Wickerhamomyces mucosus TaxID=1378264 RepID=A0A9P8PVY8_9ASCO|nr:hypothetical protein WICMUC_001401 [Wickerhamomyces mucosus]